MGGVGQLDLVDVVPEGAEGHPEVRPVHSKVGIDGIVGFAGSRSDTEGAVIRPGL